MNGEADAVGAAAFDYLMYIGYFTLGWCWVKAAVTAQDAIKRGSTDTDFYQAKMSTAEFYFKRILPRAALHAQTAGESSDSLMALESAGF